MPLTESRVRQFLCLWLNREGYNLLDLARDWGHPPRTKGRRGAPTVTPVLPDIYAKRRGQSYYYYIEAKGDPPTTTAFYNAIGEIQARMGATTPARYGIGLPMSFCKTICQCFTYEAWRNSGVYILLVDGRGTVAELQPTRANYNHICSR